ncbi:MAG: Hpt domain-containing protein [Lachnospiraceae bacterium]|nr:Hpt domain-containing protein [Lachnospiraceae bacterium]MBP5183885.1 Hpt domain-containing protein [Lachnospiraceae bacterium]
MSALIDELKNSGGIDVAGALERMGDSEELYETILGMFLTDENYEQLKNAYAAGDKDSALGYAHTIKGMCGNMGFDRLFHYSDDMVETFRGNRSCDTDLLMTQITEEYARIMEILRKYLA